MQDRVALVALDERLHLDPVLGATGQGCVKLCPRRAGVKPTESGKLRMGPGLTGHARTPRPVPGDGVPLRVLR